MYIDLLKKFIADYATMPKTLRKPLFAYETPTRTLRKGSYPYESPNKTLGRPFRTTKPPRRLGYVLRTPTKPSRKVYGEFCRDLLHCHEFCFSVSVNSQIVVLRVYLSSCTSLSIEYIAYQFRRQRTEKPSSLRMLVTLKLPLLPRFKCQAPAPS